MPGAETAGAESPATAFNPPATVPVPWDAAAAGALSKSISEPVAQSAAGPLGAHAEPRGRVQARRRGDPDAGREQSRNSRPARDSGSLRKEG